MISISTILARDVLQMSEISTSSRTGHRRFVEISPDFALKEEETRRHNAITRCVLFEPIRPVKSEGLSHLSVSLVQKDGDKQRCEEQINEATPGEDDHLRAHAAQTFSD